MIRLISKISHTEMWVAEDRVYEYLAAGHTLAAEVPVSEHKLPDSEAEKVIKLKKPRTRSTKK